MAGKYLPVQNTSRTTRAGRGVLAASGEDGCGALQRACKGARWSRRASRGKRARRGIPKEAAGDHSAAVRYVMEARGRGDGEAGAGARTNRGERITTNAKKKRKEKRKMRKAKTGNGTTLELKFAHRDHDPAGPMHARRGTVHPSVHRPQPPDGALVRRRNEGKKDTRKNTESKNQNTAQPRGRTTQ